MDHEMKPLRIKPGEITIVQHLVKSLREGSITVNKAVELFCDMNIVVNFCNKWEDSQDLFEDHAKRYFAALLPETGIAFHETDRYTKPPKNAQFRQTPSPTPPPPDSHSHHCSSSFIDVAVFATRDYKIGDIVDLKGGLVDLTEEEDDTFRASGSKMDFSVLWSSRKDCFCLLLGPARFVNHDCRNNVEFMPIGAHMKFKVVEPIAANEQIFTRYGDHYFDTDNASCLCSTCEQLKRGAFTIPLVAEPPKLEGSAIASSSNLKDDLINTGVNSNNRLSLPQNSRRTSSSTSSSSSSSSSDLSSLGESEKSDSSNSAPTFTTRNSRSTTTMTITNTTTSSPNKKLTIREKFNKKDSAEEKRRSERTNLPIDEFRIRPRIIHPPLAPPPGYKLDYQTWDPIKKILVFIGRRQAGDNKGKENRKWKGKGKGKEVNLGKRKRLESSPEVTSMGRGRGRPRKILKGDKGKKITKFRKGHDSSSDESSSSSEDDETSSEEEEEEEEQEEEEEEEVEVEEEEESSEGEAVVEEEVVKLLTPKKKERKVKPVRKGRTAHWCYSDEEGFDEPETFQDIIQKSVAAGLAELEAEKEEEEEDSDDDEEEEQENESDDDDDESEESEEEVPSTKTRRGRGRPLKSQSNTVLQPTRITRRSSILPSANLVPSTSTTTNSSRGRILSKVATQLALVVPTRNRPRASMPNLTIASTSTFIFTDTNTIPVLTSPSQQTRAKQPIPESLKHLIHSEAVTGGIGGWDETIKKYLSPKKLMGGSGRRHSVHGVGGGSKEGGSGSFSVDISPR